MPLLIIYYLIARSSSPPLLAEQRCKKRRRASRGWEEALFQRLILRIYLSIKGFKGSRPLPSPSLCSSSVIARDCINVFLPKRSLLRERYKDQPLRRTAFASRPLREITQCPISSLLLSFPFFLFRLYESRPAPAYVKCVETFTPN